MTRLKAALVAFGMLLTLTSCAQAPPAGPRIDPAISGFIPADTKVLAGLRLEKVQKTTVYQKYLAERIPQIDSFAAQTGIKLANLWEILYISNGSRAAIIGHGMFSDEAEPELQKRGGTRFKYKAFTMVGGDREAVLLVNQTVFAAGDTDQLKAMVDAHEQSAAPPPALAQLLARMPATSQIWVAYSGGGLSMPVDPGSNFGNLNKMLGMIQSGTLYLDLSTGLNGLAETTSPSEQAAEQLESGLRAFIGFGRLSVPANKPELQQAWDGLRPTREGAEVKLHVDESEEMVGKLMGLAGGKLAPSR